MRTALTALDGIEEEDVHVDVGANTVKVNCDEGCTPEALVQAIKGSGFEASVAE